jgi:hypothetical protein
MTDLHSLVATKTDQVTKLVLTIGNKGKTELRSEYKVGLRLRSQAVGHLVNWDMRLEPASSRGSEVDFSRKEQEILLHPHPIHSHTSWTCSTHLCLCFFPFCWLHASHIYHFLPQIPEIALPSIWNSLPWKALTYFKLSTEATPQGGPPSPPSSKFHTHGQGERLTSYLW